MKLFSVIPQALGKTSSPTFAGLTITGNSVFGLNSSVFQPTTDSTTFFQVLDADGGIPVFNVDTTNERVGVGLNNPAYNLDINTSSVNTRANVHVAGNNQAGALITEDTRTGGQAVALIAGISSSIFSFSDSGYFSIFAESLATVLANPGGTGPGVFRVNANGDAFFGLSTGSRVWFIASQVALDDIKVGSSIAMDHAGVNKNLNFFPDGTGATGRFITFIAYNGSSWRSVLEYQHSSGVEPDLLLVKSGGCVGIGESAPETLTEWTSTVPYLTLHNSTHEDTDGGRESRLNFKGEQSGGEETTLTRIEVGHDGTGDDEKGYLDIFINDGDDGDSPTHQIRVGSNGVGIGTNAPHSTDTVLHLYDGSSGVTVPWTGRHNLIVEGDDTTGISILTPDNKVGSLVWGSPSDSNHAYIDCEQALNGMFIGAGGVQTMVLVSGKVGILVTDPHSALEVAGAISSATVTITESTANLDVSGINVLFVNPDAATTITGFANGVAGQILFISAVANGQDITMVHNSGTQKVFLHTGGNETLSSEFGGWTLTCDGSNWYDTEHSKHV